MWATVERSRGRDRVIADACQPARLLLDYNAVVAGDPKAARWSPALTSRLSGLLAQRSGS